MVIISLGWNLLETAALCPCPSSRLPSARICNSLPDAMGENAASVQLVSSNGSLFPRHPHS